MQGALDVRSRRSCWEEQAKCGGGRGGRREDQGASSLPLEGTELLAATYKALILARPLGLEKC